MNIEEAIEYAEGALNHGWTLDITIYSGSAHVNLYDEEKELCWCPSPEGNLPKQIMEACVKSHGL